ncbi:MAG: hypothetical protein J2P15_15225 [Micromonosporaceae bacterium]|nr:hypothetical protein [Micromonosporaceae bacterium]
MPTPAKKKTPTLRIVLGVIGAVVVVIVAIVGYVASRSEPKSAAVGDCMHANGDDANSLKKVACTDPTWNYKVVGKVNSVTESEWQNGSDDPTGPTGVCHNYPSTTASFWEGTPGSTGYVLCLQARDSGGGASPAAGG